MLISSDISGENPTGSKGSENEGFDKGLHSVTLSVNEFNADKAAKLHLTELQTPGSNPDTFPLKTAEKLKS